MAVCIRYLVSPVFCPCDLLPLPWTPGEYFFSSSIVVHFSLQHAHIHPKPKYQTLFWTFIQGEHSFYSSFLQYSSLQHKASWNNSPKISQTERVVLQEQLPFQCKKVCSNTIIDSSVWKLIQWFQDTRKDHLLMATSLYEFSIGTVEPWYNKVPRNWQNLFAKTRFRYIGVLFHIILTVYTVEPRYKEPLYSKVLGIMNDCV